MRSGYRRRNLVRAGLAFSKAEHPPESLVFPPRCAQWILLRPPLRPGPFRMAMSRQGCLSRKLENLVQIVSRPSNRTTRIAAPFP